MARAYASAASPFHPVAEGVKVAVRLQPAGGGDRIDGLEAAADGRMWLKVRVSVPPERGKANKALTKLLAKSWRLPAGRIELVAGAKARNKTVLVRGEAAAVRRRLEAWLDSARLKEGANLKAGANLKKEAGIGGGMS